MDLKTQALPLARIKKIMKLDGDVKMISAEAPMLFAKAAEIFIHELTLRAWVHTEDNKRRTLQRNDIAMAVTKYDQFDFLIDIVPRDEIKQSKAQNEATVRTSMNSDQVHYYFQLAQQQASANQGVQSSGTATQPIQIVQPSGGQIQTINIGSPVEQVYYFFKWFEKNPYTHVINIFIISSILGDHQHDYSPSCYGSKSATIVQSTNYSTATTATNIHHTSRRNTNRTTDRYS